MSMYNLIEYDDNYSKTSGSLWQCYKDDPNNNITQSESFKSKIKITEKPPVDGNTKKFWNNCTIKIFKQFLENTWNAID